jgi:hypothetical protein
LQPPADNLPLQTATPEKKSIPFEISHVPPPPPTPQTLPIPTTDTTPDTAGSLLIDQSLSDQALLARLARLVLDTGRSLDDRSEALSHLLNLSVEDPTATLLPLLADKRLPESLCQHILEDSLNSPISWQLDAHLSALTHRKEESLVTEAREHLTFLIGTDYGDNLVAWTAASARAKAVASAESK